MRLEEFYADPKRRGSDERSLGRGWTSSNYPGTTFSVYWLRETGEVVALLVGPVVIGPGAPKPFGVYLPRTQTVGRDDQEVLVIGKVARPGDVEAIVNASNRDPRTLEWLRERLAKPAE